ncbi:MAG: S9 family peptidase [Chloroflexi bacterium]|nr:S9 family peptidase [Chloroflexota bacterium]
MPEFPIAPKRPHIIAQHGQTRVDDYFWLRQREDPAVLEYLKAENDYLAEMLQHTQPLQQQLFEEMKARLKEDDASVPEQRGEYFYYTRYETGKQYPLYCRKRSALDAPEELLLDQNALAAGREFCRVGAYSVSPDHQKLAYSLDLDGTEICTIYIKNLIDGTLYPETIPNTYGNVYSHGGAEWANDSATLFYITLDATTRPYQLHRHMLGSDPAQDVLLYTESDETYYLFLLKSRSRAYLQILSHSTLASEWQILPADQPTADWQVFAPRRPGIEYSIEHHGDRFLVVTNENALNFRLMATPVTATSPDNWREVLPHRSDVLIEGALAFENHLVLFEREGGLPQIRLSAPDAVSNVHYVPFPEPVYSVAPTTNPEFKTDRLRFTYSSLITPNSVIDYHFDTHAWELKKQDEIPSGHNPADYVTERLHATAPDGTLVPISIVYKRGLEKNGRNPTLLYGYGAYGFTIEAAFSPNRFSLIQRGFVFAIGHIRGGSDMGRAWYDGGRMFNKRNSFTDFIACAEHLIAAGYTSTDHLAIMGGSAGGLLVGACLTMRPDLYQAVIAQVPFVDVVTTMSDASIPLTTMEYDQWGNPAEKEQFDYLMSYSPYDNIRAVDYPDVLITTGLNDPRVAYWEPAKFAAKLRAAATSHNLILLKTNMDAGHAGASGRYDYLKEIALEYAFLIDRLNGAR